MNREQRESLTLLIKAEVFYMVGMVFMLTAESGNWVNVVFGILLGVYGMFTAAKHRHEFIGKDEDNAAK